MKNLIVYVHTEAQMRFLDDWLSTPWRLEDKGGETQ